MTRRAPDSRVSNNSLVSTIIIYPYMVPIYPWKNYGNNLGSPLSSLHPQGAGPSLSIIQVKVRLVHISHIGSLSIWIISLI